MEGRAGLRPAVRMGDLRRTVNYLLALRDPLTGGFRFASHQPATFMGTAYALLALELLGALPSLEPAAKDAAEKYLLSGSQTDGSFKDPLFDPNYPPSGYDTAYFVEETTTFCQQTLDALQAPLPPYRPSAAGTSPQSVVKYLGSMEWKNPWLEANRVLFALSQTAYSVERYGRAGDLGVIDAALDWIDERRSPKTGLWQGPHPAPLENQMAATVHFTIFHAYRKRPIRYAGQIIDSCLRLQRPDGLFSPYGIGHSCLDADAVDLMSKALLSAPEKQEEVKKSMSRALKPLWTLMNEDGGFAHSRTDLWRPRGLDLPYFISKRAAKGDYECPGKYLSSKMTQSNGFSTWFRLLALAGALPDVPEGFRSRRLPFLGYHGA